MAKLKMQTIEIAALIKDSKKLMELLQRRSVIELKNCDDEKTVCLNTASNISMLEKHIQTANNALEQLNLFAPEKQNLLSMLSGRKEIEKHRFGEIVNKTDGFMNMCFEINSSVKTINECSTQIARNEALIDSLSIWSELDIAQQFSGTKNTVCYIGTLPGSLSGEEIEAKLSALNENITEVYAKTVNKGKEITCAVIFCHISQKNDIYSALRDIGFAAVSDPTRHPPKVRIERYTEEVKQLQKKSETAKSKIISYAGRQDDIEFLIDWYTLRRDKYQALGNVGMTEKTIIIIGYIPQRNIDALVKELDKKFSVAVTVGEPDKDDDVPVLLSNNKFSHPVEGITEMYALPSMRDPDPTPIISFFYYLFFGLMLSDAGYGLVMTIATAIILKKTKVEDNLRRSLKMFFYCGISTVFWGALFGSWFGDIVPVIAREYFGKTITTSQIALWFEPMSDPIKLLLVSFALGIIHLFVGVGVNCYLLIKEKKIFDAIFDTVPVYMMIIGVAPAGAGILTSVDGNLQQYGLYLALAGMIIFILTSSRSSRNPLARLGGGLYAMYNFASGYLGDILSYSRLLALGLATGSIAGVINMIAVMPQSAVVKTIMLIIVFPVGHTLNMAINLLGAYVHTARLQFVEMFSKFYEGGGRAFSPLKANTKYVKFKEENQ